MATASIAKVRPCRSIRRQTTSVTFTAYLSSPVSGRSSASQMVSTVTLSSVISILISIIRPWTVLHRAGDHAERARIEPDGFAIAHGGDPFFSLCPPYGCLPAPRASQSVLRLFGQRVSRGIPQSHAGAFACAHAEFDDGLRSIVGRFVRCTLCIPLR